MRIDLPKVLLVSAVLHITLLSLVFLHYHRHHGPVSLTAGSTSIVNLIYALKSETTASGQLATHGNFQPDPNPDGTSAPLPPETKPVTPAPASTPASLALQDQSRAHLRPADPLNPGSPPHVSSGDGIVFILDVSGSMYEPFAGSTRLAFAREILAQRIRALRDGTPFSLVVYGERGQRSGPLVVASEATRNAAIQFLARDYDLGGGTDLPVGLTLATDLDVGSILLVTDGDLNMKESELFPQARRILGPVGACPALTIIGISPRPETDDRYILQDLAALENGKFIIAKLAGVPDIITAKTDAAP